MTGGYVWFAGMLWLSGMMGMADRTQKNVTQTLLPQSIDMAEKVTTVSACGVGMLLSREHEIQSHAFQTQLDSIIPLTSTKVFERWRATKLCELCLMRLGLLDAQAEHIMDALPAGLACFLSELSVCENQLTVLPMKVRELPQLRCLDCSSNCIRIFPIEVCSLGRLELFNIAHNPIDRLPDNIGTLFELRMLNVSYTDIDRLPSSVLSLMNLRVLYLQRTFIKTLPLLPDGLEILVVDRRVDIANVRSSVRVIRV